MVEQYLEQIFANLPQNDRNSEYRENLKKQMEVVFNAECAAGADPEKALSVAVNAAPGYEEICTALDIFEQVMVRDTKQYEKQVRWNSFWFAAAIGLFVASPVGMIWLSVWKHAYNLVGALAMLLTMLGIGTGLLAYSLREKQELAEFRPESSPKSPRIWPLLLGVFFALCAGGGVFVSFAYLHGKLFSWACASSLIDAALAVLCFLYYAQVKRWFGKFRNM